MKQKAAHSLPFVELVVVTLAVGASTARSAWLPAAALLAALLWATRWGLTRRVGVALPVHLPVAVLLLLAVATWWVTPDRSITGPQMARLALGVAWGYALIAWAERLQRLRWLVRGMLVGGLALAAAAPFVVDWNGLNKLPLLPVSLYNQFRPLVGDTVNPNVMAGAIVCVLPVALALGGWGSGAVGWRDRTLAAVAAAVLGSMLVLTQSRGAMLALGAALLVLATLRWRWGGLVLLVGMGVVGLAFWRNPSLASQVVSVGMRVGQGSRLELWSRAIYLIEDFPWTGVGLGMYGPVVDNLYPLFTSGPGLPHAHNLALQVAVDLGLPGLVAWLSIVLLVYAAAWQSWRSARRRKDSWGSALTAGLLAAHTALLVHGVSDAVTWGMVRTAVVPWGLWAVVFAAWRVIAQAPPADASAHAD